MRYLLLGSGKMGKAIAYDLCRSGSSEVTLADRDVAHAKELLAWLRTALKPKTKLAAIPFDAAKPDAAAMKGYDCIISAMPYDYNYGLAKLAISSKANFCDLGGNSVIVEKELSLHKEAKAAGVNIVPDCGLAPGMAGLLAVHALAQLGGKADSLRIRDGGLPQNPRPPLDYMIVFSVHGLINEYKEKCHVLRDGKPAMVEPLTGIEDLSFPGFPPLEAAHNSGGISTLCTTLKGKVKDLDYKTVRYKGHFEKVRLLFDLGFFDERKRGSLSPREMSELILEERLPSQDKDLVLMRVEARRGAKRYVLDMVDRFDERTGLTAMMRCTGFPVSAIAQMLAKGEVRKRGAIPQELCIDVTRFMDEMRRRGLVFHERLEG